MIMSQKTNTAYPEQIFHTPFSAAYWRTAVSELKEPKMLVLAALFIALRMAIKGFKIPIADNMSVFFTFVVNALGSFIYGPVVGFVSGAVCDTLSFIIKPSGPYNPAFMLIEGLGSFLYGVILYRSRVSVVRLFLSKLSVSVLCNLFLTPLFLSLMYSNGKTMFAYFVTRLPKNIIMLPIETLLLVITFSVMLPVLSRMRSFPWLRQDRLTIGLLGH